MNDAEHISHRLSSVQIMLDEIAREIKDSDLPYIRAEIENVAMALSYLLDIQQTIYAHNPGLTPEYLQQVAQNSDRWNREFGKLLLQNESLLASNNPREAINLTEQFIQSEPPEFFVGMANAEIERIVALFKL